MKNAQSSRLLLRCGGFSAKCGTDRDIIVVVNPVSVLVILHLFLNMLPVVSIVLTSIRGAGLGSGCG